MAEMSSNQKEPIDEKILEHNKKVLGDLVAGDLIEIKRDFYSHWCVYVGDNYIIHLSSRSSTRYSDMKFLSANIAGYAVVHLDAYWNVVKSSYAYRNNSKDNELSPLPNEAVVKRAFEKLGDDHYNIFSHNCEHFVNWCRYGLPMSDQLKNVIRFGCFVSKSVFDLGDTLKQLVKPIPSIVAAKLQKNEKNEEENQVKI